MGGKQAKPNKPEENEAKLQGDLAREGMESRAREFLQSCRLGDPSLDTLGYRLTDNRLVSQEIKFVIATRSNVVNDDVDKMVGAVFSQDWETLAKTAANTVVSFLNGFLNKNEPPVPQDVADTREYGKSFLLWEHQSLVQYALYIKSTNVKSLGFTTQNDQYTMMVAMCKGIVDYEFVDPQAVLYQVAESNPDITEEEYVALLQQIGKALDVGAELRLRKQRLQAGIGKNDTVDVDDGGDDSKSTEPAQAQASSFGITSFASPQRAISPPLQMGIKSVPFHKQFVIPKPAAKKVPLVQKSVAVMEKSTFAMTNGHGSALEEAPNGIMAH